MVFHWLSTIDRVEPDGLARRADGLDEDGFPSPPVAPRGWPPTRVVLALATGRRPLAARFRQRPPVQVATASSTTDWVLATGLPGVFAGGDVVAGERSVTTAIGHGRRVAASIDDWLAGRAPGRKVRAQPRAVRSAEHVVLRGRFPEPPAAARAGPAELDLRRGGARPRRRHRIVRGPALPVLRKLLLLRQLLRALPGQRRSKDRSAR